MHRSHIGPSAVRQGICMKTTENILPHSLTACISIDFAGKPKRERPMKYKINPCSYHSIRADCCHSGGSTTADAGGDYSFLVSSGWTGTVSPSKAGYAFNPANRTYTNVTADQFNQDYAAIVTSTLPRERCGPMTST
jgi:hypothetical protein